MCQTQSVQILHEDKSLLHSHYMIEFPKLWHAFFGLWQSFLLYPSDFYQYPYCGVHLITNITILQHDNGLGSTAESIVNDVVQEQSLDIDAVSGATVSSKCILKAVENAIEN